MTDAEILWNNVKRICMAKGTTVSDIEDKVGYTRGHLRQRATRGCNIYVEHIRYYAQALGVPMVELMEGMLDE